MWHPYGCLAEVALLVHWKGVARGCLLKSHPKCALGFLNQNGVVCKGWTHVGQEHAGQRTGLSLRHNNLLDQSQLIPQNNRTEPLMGICHMLWSVPGLAWGRPHNRLMHRCWKLARSNGWHFLRYLAQGRWQWSFGVNSTGCVPTRWGPRHNQASLAVSCRSILREVNTFTSTDATHPVQLLCQDTRKQPPSLQLLLGLRGPYLELQF